MATMKLEIVTPKGLQYDNQVEMVVVKTIDGDRGILPNHEPFVTGVDIGKVKIQTEEEEYFLAASHGYMEVTPDKTTILMETAEFADEIDVDEALEAKKQAEQKLDRKHEDHIDEREAEIALQKALTRLEVAQGDFGEYELEETE